MAMDPDAEVELEYFPFIRKYKSGRIERLAGTEILPASVDPATGVASKDVDIHPAAAGVTARIYLPPCSDERKKLPVLVYYHGGGFIVGTAMSPLYHPYINSLAAKAGILVVSVNYRRAPEDVLPAAYDDSWAALQWVASRADAWVAAHGDVERVFLAGDSAGGNIAHNVAMRAAAGLSHSSGPGAAAARIVGLALVHPYFWGTKPVEGETTDPAARDFYEKLWKVVYPAGESADDVWLNPLAAGAPSLQAGLPCRRLAVFVAGKDGLRERGRVYYEALVGSSGWGGEAELVETEEEDHVFHLFNPTCEKAVAKMERFVAFLSR